jgi:membrane protein implicated in regulation of membrane protease activity
MGHSAASSRRPAASRRSKLEQQSGLFSDQKSLLFALLGGVIVAAGWFAVSMSILTAIIFGLPIGAVSALIVYRTVLQRSRKSPPSIGSQSSSNGVEPAQKKVEDAKATTPLKLR